MCCPESEFVVNVCLSISISTFLNFSLLLHFSLSFPFSLHLLSTSPPLFLFFCSCPGLYIRRPLSNVNLFVLIFFSTSKTAGDNLFLLSFQAYGFCDAATICQPRKEVSQDPILMMPWTWTITIQNYEKISVRHLRCPVCGISLVPPPMHRNTAMQMPFWTSGFSSLFFNISLKELWAICLP